MAEQSNDIRRKYLDEDKPESDFDQWKRKQREAAERERAREAAERQQVATTWAQWWSAVDERIKGFQALFWPEIDKVILEHLHAMSEAVGQPLGERAADVRDDVESRIEKEVRALEAKIEQRFMARLPIAKEFVAGVVHYAGEVVAFKGSTYQALKDSAQDPSHTDEWICPCSAGRDAASPRVRGAYDATTKSRALDCVLFGESTYMATRDAPGLPFDRDGWELLAGHGPRGGRGERGPQGQRGEKGEPGPTPPTIARWRIDREDYRATPVITDGELGPPLELRKLFERFLAEVA